GHRGIHGAVRHRDRTASRGETAATRIIHRTIAAGLVGHLARVDGLTAPAREPLAGSEIGLDQQDRHRQQRKQPFHLNATHEKPRQGNTQGGLRKQKTRREPGTTAQPYHARSCKAAGLAPDPSVQTEPEMGLPPKMARSWVSVARPCRYPCNNRSITA